MALTPRQKAANKAANRIRNRAHAARYRLLRDAVEAAKNAPLVLEANAIFVAAEAESEHVRAQVSEQIAALEVRIVELKSQVEALRDSPEVAAAVDRRREAANAWIRLEQEHVAAVKAHFQDLSGPAQFSAAAWQPPMTVLEEMEMARRAVMSGEAAQDALQDQEGQEDQEESAPSDPVDRMR